MLLSKLFTLSLLVCAGAAPPPETRPIWEHPQAATAGTAVGGAAAVAAVLTARAAFLIGRHYERACQAHTQAQQNRRKSFDEIWAGFVRTPMGARILQAMDTAGIEDKEKFLRDFACCWNRQRPKNMLSSTETMSRCLQHAYAMQEFRHTAKQPQQQQQEQQQQHTPEAVTAGESVRPDAFSDVKLRTIGLGSLGAGGVVAARAGGVLRGLWSAPEVVGRAAGLLRSVPGLVGTGM